MDRIINDNTIGGQRTLDTDIQFLIPNPANEFEETSRAIIGTLFVSPTVAPRITEALPNPECFPTETDRKIFIAVKKMVDSGQELNIPSIRDYLNRNGGSVPNLIYYIDDCMDRWYKGIDVFECVEKIKKHYQFQRGKIELSRCQTAEELIETSKKIQRRAKTIQSKRKGDSDCEETLAIHETDLGNSKRFARMFGNRVRYCFPWGKFLIWDGMRWSIDKSGAVNRYAEEVVRSIYKDGWDTESLEKRKQLLKYAVSCESQKKLDAMLKLVRPEIPVLPEQLDQHPYLLCCPNGVIDLTSGVLINHNPNDFITKITPTSYNPDAKCPRWDNFLYHIMSGNQELIKYIQRVLGYGLTGTVKEQVLPIFYGVGANGKSTLINAILDTLGDDYALQGPRNLLMLRGGDTHETVLATLHGKRLVFCSEPDTSKGFAEAILKQVTGGDTLTVRRMREDYWSFKPTHKIILCANHKPNIKGTDHAVWRRIKLAPFSVKIPDDEQDRNLGEKLRAEREGILAWLVRGCLEWQKIGLLDPEDVKNATHQYRQEVDRLSEFIEDACEVGDDFSSSSRDLFESYSGWCENNGADPVTKIVFGKLLQEKGFERIRRHGGNRAWKGLRLKDSESPL